MHIQYPTQMNQVCSKLDAEMALLNSFKVLGVSLFQMVQILQFVWLNRITYDHRCNNLFWFVSDRNFIILFETQ